MDIWKNKIIWITIVTLVVIVAGISLYERIKCDPRYCQTFEPQSSEIDLVLGGNFQNKSYHFKDSTLTYHYSNGKEREDTTKKLSSADVDSINEMFIGYELDEMKSDQPTSPDAPYFQLTVKQDTKTYKLYLWSSENPAYYLAQELDRFFAQVMK